MPFEGSVNEGDFLKVIYECTQVDVYKKHTKDIRYPKKHQHQSRWISLQNLQTNPCIF